MSLKLRTVLINISVPKEMEELKQQIEKQDWKSAIKTSAKLNANLSDIQSLIDGTF